MSNSGSEREVFYVADPMCSWCWGFSPVIRSIVDQVNGKAVVTPIMGGLRPLTREPMSDQMKADIRHHWEDVAERSGQPFDMAFFDRDRFVYDTEPACRAVGVVRRLARARALPFMDAVQRAFYSENRDVTDSAVLADIAGGQGVDRAAFLGTFDDVSSVYETAGDFHAARQLGVTGYPTVIVRKDETYALLTAGYQAYETLVGPLNEWLESGSA